MALDISTEAPDDRTALREQARTRLLDQLLGDGDGDGRTPLGLVHGLVADPTFTSHGCPLRLPSLDGAGPGAGGVGGTGPGGPVVETGVYRRLFPTLAPYTPTNDAIEELGAPGGPMDVNRPDPKTKKCAQPGERIADTLLAKPTDPSKTSPADAGIPAGYTYVGQFLDHNITFQADADFDRNDPATTTNYRDARVDLSHVYGLGPKTQSFAFYDNVDTGKFWIDPDREYDVPRNPQDVPLVADPRDDNTIITIQLHLAFMKFHNAVVDMLKGSVPDVSLFTEAKRQVVWHYQWMILNDWLPRILAKDVYEKLKKAAEDREATFPLFNPAFGKPVDLPVEFTAAAYRLHSLPVEEYTLNDVTAGHLFDLRRPFSRLRPSRVIDWRRYFVVPGAKDQTGHAVETQYAKRFDRRIIHGFLQMPPPIDSPLNWLESSSDRKPLPKTTPYQDQDYAPLCSIAIRNLMRANSFDGPKGKGLPSGEDVARAVFNAYAISRDPYTVKDFKLTKADGFTNDFASVPLWYYILGEGALDEVKAGHPDVGSLKLGAVGSAIVGEVIFAMVKADPGSYIANNFSAAPKWQPTLGRTAGTFYMSDMLRVAGVV
ncbi:peroxidase family protein [Embleya sp. NPDC059237]|uniref:peroxidase family protein n=1 Tax=Embleya sp. NPDC059237 TaxID=3346784 RepID=UPI0036A5E365